MRKTIDDTLLRSFWEIRPLLKVVHHVPGRIRLRLTLKAITKRPDVDAKEVVDLLERLHGIDGIRVNRAAGTVIIEYRPADFDPAFWTFVLSGDRDEVANEIRRRLA